MVARAPALAVVLVACGGGHGKPGADAKCTPTTTFADPILGQLADNGGATETAAGSAALGAGVMCPPTDQRGMPRPPTACTSGSVEPQ